MFKEVTKFSIKMLHLNPVVTLLAAVILFCFSAVPVLAKEVYWDSTSHQAVYLDFNGDDIKDLLLQAVGYDHDPQLILGSRHNYKTEFLTNNAIPLAPVVNGGHWLVADTQVITGAFGSDSYEDVLVVNNKTQQVFVIEGNNKRQFKIRDVPTGDWKWLNSGKEKEIHAGDFNGDKRTDFLVLFANKGKHRVYHTNENGEFSLAQSIKNSVKWGLKKSEKLIIADFNDDGRDDIFALAKKRKRKHYLVYANKKGLFKPRNTETIKQDFAGVDWYANAYSSAVISGSEGMELVRLYNENGGINEEGQFVPDKSDPMRHKACKRIYYKFNKKKARNRCKKKVRKADSAGRQRVNTQKAGIAIQASGNMPLGQTALAFQSSSQTPPKTAEEIYSELVPVEISSSPSSSVGAYPEINTNFTLSWSEVATATSYKIWVSYDHGENVENTYLATSATSYTFNEADEGSRFYYIQACNVNGCSGLSPYISVYVFNRPQSVKQFFATTDNVQTGDSITLSWLRPEGLIGSGGYYKVQQITPYGAESWLPNVVGGTATSTNVVLNSGEGEYRFKIYSCNKSDRHCSEESGYIAKVSVLPEPTAGAPIISNLTYTPVVSSVGIIQQYSFSYQNASLCKSSGLKKNDVPVSGSTTYIDTSTPGSGTYSWQILRSEAVKWEFTVSCFNDEFPEGGGNFQPASSQTAIAIVNPNQVPTAINDVKSVGAGETIQLDILKNDFDPDLAAYDNSVNHAGTADAGAQRLTISNPQSLSVTKGTLQCTAEKCSYTAPATINANETVNFTYNISDNAGGSDTGMVSINLMATTNEPLPVVGSWNLEGVTEGLVEAGYFPVTVALTGTQGFGFSYVNARECKSYELKQDGTLLEGSSVTYVEDNGTLQSGTYTWSEVREVPVTWDFYVRCTNNSFNNNTQALFHASARVVGNTAPVASNDSFSIDFGDEATLDVLANDTDGEEQALKINAISVAGNGSVDISTDQLTVIYSPNPGFSGTDSFTYTIYDGFGGEATATVNVVVGDPLQPPTITPPGGTYGAVVNVKISMITKPSATPPSIYYTIDGTTPTPDSEIYGGIVSIAGDTVLKAVSVKNGWPNSEVAVESYVITVQQEVQQVTVSSGQHMVVNVDASDDHGVSTVQFSLDQATWHSDADGQAPWIYDFGSKPAGQYVVYVKAIDSTGKESSVVPTNVTVNEQLAITNLTISPLSVGIGQSHTLYFEYSNATKCFDSDNTSTIYYQGASASGSYSGEAPLRYAPGNATLNITCENATSSVSESFHYSVDKLEAPGGLEVL